MHALNFARTDKKDIFFNHCTENIYKVIHEQIKQTKQCVKSFLIYKSLRKVQIVSTYQLPLVLITVGHHMWNCSFYLRFL